MVEIKKFKKKDYEEQIRRHKIRKGICIILIILLVVIIIVAAKITADTKTYTTYKVNKSVKWDVALEAKTLRYGNDILIYSIDGANCTDSKGSQRWNITYQMKTPLVNVNGEFVTIGDYNGNTLYVMDKSGVKGEIMTPLPIKKFAVSESGYVAAILGNNSENCIYLYSMDGEVVGYFHTTMDIMGYPFDLSLSDNGKLVAVDFIKVDLDNAERGYVSCVNFFNFGAVGANFKDNLVGYCNYDSEVVSRVYYMDNENCFALSDSHLFIYKGKQEPVPGATIELDAEVQSLYYNDNNIGVVYVDTQNDGYYMKIYSKKGSLKGTVKFDLEYSDIVFGEDRVIIYNGTECAIYTFSGKEKFDGTIDGGVLLIIPVSNTKYTVVTKEEINHIKLK